MSADVVEVQVDRKIDTVTVLMKLRSTVDKEARLVRARPVPVKELAEIWQGIRWPRWRASSTWRSRRSPRRATSSRHHPTFATTLLRLPPMATTASVYEKLYPCVACQLMKLNKWGFGRIPDFDITINCSLSISVPFITSQEIICRSGS